MFVLGVFVCFYSILTSIKCSYVYVHISLLRSSGSSKIIFLKNLCFCYPKQLKHIYIYIYVRICIYISNVIMTLIFQFLAIQIIYLLNIYLIFGPLFFQLVGNCFTIFNKYLLNNQNDCIISEQGRVISVFYLHFCL